MDYLLIGTLFKKRYVKVRSFAIFKDNVDIYKEFLEKKEQDFKVKDNGELKEDLYTINCPIKI